MAQIAAPTGVAMLPLIVGALEDNSSAETDETPLAEEVEFVEAEVVEVAEDAVETKA